MPWHFVVNNRSALDWVLEHGRMAFKDSVSTSRLKVGDSVAVYATRQVLPRADAGQIAATGELTSEVQAGSVDVAGTEYAQWCDVKFNVVPPLGSGVALQPLVESLKFIVFKDGWAGYLRRTLIEIKYDEYKLIVAELSQRLEKTP